MGELFERIREYARRKLSEKRYEHSVRVAETAAGMCRLYGIDEEKGLVAGIAHDICKEIGGDEMLELALRDGGGLSELERSKPDLLHGRAAAVRIGEEFGVDDPDIVDAVRNHTCGRPGLCDLGKVLFVADKIEPGRPQSTEEYRENLFRKDLDGITLAVVEENGEFLARKGKKSPPGTAEWLSELRARCGGRK